MADRVSKKRVGVDKTNDIFARNLNNYIHWLLGIVGGLAFLYGLVHSLRGKSLLGVVDLIIGGVLLGMLFFGKKLAQEIKSVFLAIFLQIFLLFLIYDGATGNVGYLWMMIYPSVILYLLGTRKGGVWVSLGSVLMMVLSGLHFVGLINLPYETIVIVQFNVIYVVISGLSYLAEIDRQRRREVIEDLSIKLSFIIKNSPLVVFILDKKGTFTFSDGAGLKKLGLTSGQAVGESAYEMYKDYPKIIQGIKKALAGKKVSELIWMGKVVFQTQFSPMMGSDNKIVGVMGLAMDVEDEQNNRKKIEAKLAELEKLNKLMIGRELKMAEMKLKISEKTTPNTN